MQDVDIKVTSGKQPDFAGFMEMCDGIVTEEIIRTFAYIGEECVKRIRDRRPEDSWNDITGNLRSSIGYLLLQDGDTIMDFGFSSEYGKPKRKTKVRFETKDGKTVSFEATTPAGGKEGEAQGRRYAKALAKAYTQGIILLVVAGMDYADYVERMAGKDVLASTELWARDNAGKRLEKAKVRAEKRIQALMEKYFQ